MPAYVLLLAAAAFASPAATLAARMALRYFTRGHVLTIATFLIACAMVAFIVLKELPKLWTVVFFMEGLAILMLDIMYDDMYEKVKERENARLWAEPLEAAYSRRNGMGRA